jgi:hypothetical protein
MILLEDPFKNRSLIFAFTSNVYFKIAIDVTRSTFVLYTKKQEEDYIARYILYQYTRSRYLYTLDEDEMS